MKNATEVLAALAILCAATPAWAVGYVELAPWSVVGNGGAGSHFCMAIEGQTSYHNLSISNARITKVQNLNGVQTSTELLSNAAWYAANGGASSNMSTWYSLGISGDYLQFAETGTDAIWRVDKNTGAITPYVSNAAIASYLGLAETAQLLAQHEVAPDGEHTFYEGKSDYILKTTGTDALTTLVSAAQLSTATGNTAVSGGLTYASNGDLYWGNNTSDNIWKLVGGTGTDIVEVLSTSDIVSVTGVAGPGFGDILAAPDGTVYFYETTSDSIMRFEAANPAITLEIYVSEAELIAGPMGSDAVVSLAMYDGKLAWHRFNDYGLYVVPEPSVLALLAMGGLTLIRRRR